MADSQTMRSQQPQPNNETTKVTIGLNMTYIKTMPAILKGVSVIVGLLAMSLTAYAYNEAYYFSTFEETHCKTYAPSHGKTCPISFLVTPFVFVLAFTWTGTCVMFIVLLFIDLNKKQPFPTVDFIGHLVAGGFSILSGLCLIGYVITVFLYVDCVDEKNGRGPGFKRKAGNKTTHGKSRAITVKICTTCAQCESHNYGHWHVLFGGLFAIAAGALYIVIALFSQKGSRNRPMMMGQGQRSMAPSQAQMQAQGTPSQQANSVRQSPSTKTGSPSQAKTEDA